jgi:hypothetical protein
LTLLEKSSGRSASSVNPTTIRHVTPECCINIGLWDDKTVAKRRPDNVFARGRGTSKVQRANAAAEKIGLRKRGTRAELRTKVQSAMRRLALRSHTVGLHSDTKGARVSVGQWGTFGMSLAIVADPDIRERMRCVRILATQTPFSAVGVATWEELLDVLTFTPKLDLVVYAKHLPGLPERCASIMANRRNRVLMASVELTSLTNTSDAIQVPHPIAEETLIIVARSCARSTNENMHFLPIDLIQLISMSASSQVLVVSHPQGDAGIIEMRDGEVWTAFDALSVGEDAFARLIRPEMKARMTPTRGSGKSRTIFLGLHELLVNSLRRIEAGQVSSAPLLATPPPLESPNVVGPPPYDADEADDLNRSLVAGAM